jgi:two-component system, OmpR family, sensor histidine kinase RstB
MRRLRTQIHLTIVAVLALFAVLAGAAWWHAAGLREQGQFAEAVADTAVELLPGPERPVAELQATLDRLGPRFGVDAAVYGPGGELVAWVGRPLPLPAQSGARGHWSRIRGHLLLAVRLADGRRLVAARQPDFQHVAGLVATLALLALAVGLGAWPLVTRLTRRLERLQSRVEALGGGDLAARAPVEGRDEVADLARSFNRAAERIQGLVEAQRRQLAFASHELRSPLARLRIALELLRGDDAVRAGAARDVAELDALISELLEASRLEAVGAGERAEPLDLLGLVAEQAARTEAVVTGEPVELRGDALLLRRLVRNLLDNARRHAAGSEVTARVERTPAGARLLVADRGPGVSESERERIFEPFYRPPGTAETGSGYGLGLALVRQIARAHGGDVACRPRDGGGTEFAVVLAADPGALR